MSPSIGILAVAIGVSLGLLGAGGAIVAVPALVYLEGLPQNVASGYSLFTVCVASAIAGIAGIRQGLVSWRAVVAFGISTSVTVYVVRATILPDVPLEGFIPDKVFDRDAELMMVFSAILLVAGAAMLFRSRRPEVAASATDKPVGFLPLFVYGAGIGAVSGFLGVGGGFLMTPALVLWGRLGMKEAVATSLVLICLNAAVGVTADLAAGMDYDWPYVLTFTVLTSVGIVGGTALSRRIDADVLRRLFGWFVITLGAAVLLLELRG